MLNRPAFLAAACLVLCALPGGVQAAPPDVLLVTIDTLRANRLGTYGYANASTPTLDALAAGGVRCDDTLAVAPITLPAHSSIMTGLLPPAHGVRDNGAMALGDDAVTLAERFAAAGYQTGAFVSSAVLSHDYNLSQGFMRYDDALYDASRPNLFMIRDRNAATTAERFADWLHTMPRQIPVFAWVHFFDPHQPYAPPADCVARTRNLYDAEVSSADAGVARLLQALKTRGQIDNTLVVVTADHGESLGEHGENSHAIFVYRSTLHVPLIWSFPGRLPAGRPYPGSVSSIDIAPTLLALAQLPAGPPMQGRNLSALLRGQTVAQSHPQYSESLLPKTGFGMAPLFAVRHEGITYIRAPQPELYVTPQDPQELRNLAPQSRNAAAHHDTLLQNLIDGCAPYRLNAVKHPANEANEAMLSALGYVAPAAEQQAMHGMDPKLALPIHNRLEEARHAAQRGDWDSATRLGRALVAEWPQSASARNLLAGAWVYLKQPEQAEKEYLRSLQVDSQQWHPHLALARLAQRAGRTPQVAAHLSQALEVNPNLSEAKALLGYLDIEAGRFAAAEARFAQATHQDPLFPLALYALADLDVQRQRPAQALTWMLRTLAAAPDHYEALNEASGLLQYLGNRPLAEAFMQLAAQAQPERWQAHYNLACLAATGGDTRAALQHLHTAVAAGFDRLALLEQDPDLRLLRRLPAFAALRLLTPAEPRRPEDGMALQ